jgi:hypothetical protein
MRTADRGVIIARPKTSAERWAYLVEDAKRIVVDRDKHSRAELLWAHDTLAVHEAGHTWHGGDVANAQPPAQTAAARAPIIVKPAITQAQMADVIARFAGVVTALRDFEDRSDPDNGGSVEAGELRLDAPVLAEDIDILEESFRDMFISRSV